MRLDLVANFLIFQLGWLVAVMGAAVGVPWVGIAYALAWITAQSLIVDEGRGEMLRLGLTAVLLGYGLDSSLVLVGAIAFPEAARLGWPAPLWMAALWLMFSMTLRQSLGWLRGRYLLAALLGALGGPAAYWAGAQLGAVQLLGGGRALAAVAIVWIVGMIALLGLEVLTRSGLAPGEAASRSAASS